MDPEVMQEGVPGGPELGPGLTVVARFSPLGCQHSHPHSPAQLSVSSQRAAHPSPTLLVF